MYTPHTRCRACGLGPMPNSHYFKAGESNERLASILDLGPMPLANAFSRGNSPRPGYYPLHLMACPRCSLGQLSVVVDPQTLYSNYSYVTSQSQTMSDHFDDLFSWLAFLEIPINVIEIGSNDGVCLQRAKKLGAKTVLGIDPAQNLAKIANDAGIQTISRMFDASSAMEASEIMPQCADLILARHVFCHIDDWRGFLNNVTTVSHKNTILCIEVPWAHDMIVNCEWDTIYHEHLSYFTLRSLQFLLTGTLWKLHAVRRFSIHGGALAVVLRRADHPEPEQGTIHDFLEQEKCSPDDWRGFARKSVFQREALQTLIVSLKEKGAKIAGYGASAKASTWVAALELDKRDIYGIYDCTPQKHYATVPGSDIPVLPEGGFYVENPDYAICWAWNFMTEIQRKNEKWVAGGGKFIVPVPDVHVL